MAPRLTEKAQLGITEEAIAAAKAGATSDEDFVQILRETYFGLHPAFALDVQEEPPERTRFYAKRAWPKGPPNDVEEELDRTRQAPDSIYKDPRYAQNARALLERSDTRFRIVGGTEVRGRAFADCVAVGNDSAWGCSGTLIAPTVVVTAGHCRDHATRVLFGNSVKRGTRIAVKRRIPHPDYSDAAGGNDLMLLVLAKATRVKPRPLAPSALIDRATDGRAVGFGNVDANGMFGYGIKRQVDVPIGSPSCAGRVGGRRDADVYRCLKGLEMVAGKPMLARDTCTGDSGGPFYVADGRGEWLLAGATSRATHGTERDCGDGGIYARVDRYRDWIEDETGVSLP